MKKYLIGYSGLGDFWYYEIINAENDEDASYCAWEEACNKYEDYLGLHGIRDISEIMEEEDCSEEDANEIFNNDRESWIDYWSNSHIETTIQKLLDEGLINSSDDIINYQE